MKESQHTEWKQSWRDEYLKWICGFANADGGVLVIGRNDAGEVVGTADAKKLLVELPNKVRDLLGIMVDVNLRSQDAMEYIEIHVDDYPFPVSYKGAYHYRSGSTKQELKGAALDRFLLRKQGRHWDGVPVPHVDAADIDDKTLDAFRKQALKSQRLDADVLDESNPTLLAKLHLVEGERLNRAAVLLFHAEPESYFGGAHIKLGFFRSNSDLRYQDEVFGSLFHQVAQTVEVLRAKYLKALVSYEGHQRVEQFPVPDAALREALMNAVVHKDYSSRVPIQISVYDDKLMIWNPGRLPENWGIDDLLKKHASVPFNPDIANAFFRAGLIESWGRGIERIVEACKEADAPAPEFRVENTGVWTVFSFGSAFVQPRLDEKLGATRTSILQLMRANPNVTVLKMAAKLQISKNAVDRNIQILKKLGFIKRIGPSKGGHWETNLRPAQKSE